jgi:hypothetical protein
MAQEILTAAGQCDKPLQTLHIHAALKKLLLAGDVEVASSWYEVRRLSCKLGWQLF